MSANLNKISIQETDSWVQQHQAADLPGRNVDWLVKQREQGIALFSELGLPTTRDEEWRYTNLRALKKNVFTLSTSDQAVPQLDNIELPIISGSTLVFVNGVFSEQYSDLSKLANGVQIRRLSDVLENDADSIQDHLGQSLPKNQHGFTALNSAFCADGYVIQFSKNVVYEQAIEILFISSPQNEEAFISHPRNLIIAEQHSQCTVVERFISSDSISTDIVNSSSSEKTSPEETSSEKKSAVYLNNSITEIFAADGAHIDHYKIQQEADNAFHINGVFIKQAANSNVSNHNLALGGLVARSDIKTSLDGEGAHCEMNGLVAGKGRQHTDNHTEVIHAKPNCTSDEFYKSILDDNSRTVFRGRIVVAEDAQLTNADQQNKNLLLSKNAEADTKPQLEIYADNVKCSHGATIGQLNPKSVFYLQSRGINKETARNLLTFAFANEIIERIKVDSIREELTTLLAGQLLSGFEDLL